MYFAQIYNFFFVNLHGIQFFIAMKGKILIILFSFLFISCIERNGYYSYEEESVISLICDITWSTSTYKTENDEIGQTTYNFNRNGIYKRTDIVTNQNGEEKKSEYNGRWTFGDPSFSTIYFGGNHYWDIDKLTEKKFSFYDRTGEFGDPFMYREYYELIPYQTLIN